MAASPLELFQAGDGPGAWSALVDLGDLVFEPEYRDVAWAVASEVAKRVAHNADQVVDRLSSTGYQFASEPERGPRSRPGAEIELLVDSIDRRMLRFHVPSEVWLGEADDARHLGRLPMFMRALLVEVGGVDLCGGYPSWDPPTYERRGAHRPIHADPLFITDIRHVESDLDYMEDPEWAEMVDYPSLSFAIDQCAKAGHSGGHQLIDLPQSCFDPEIHWQAPHEYRRTRILPYLEESFAWGGFPGFADAAQVPEEIAYLRSDLVPLLPRSS